LLAWPSVGHAQRRRPLFEPTDLEMQGSGMMEIDTQFGAVRSDVPWRAVVPDVEFNLGLLPRVELDIDGAYAIEGTGDGRFTLDHPAPDNMWLSSKLALYDSRVEGATSAWAIGAQLGPKLPLANDAHGIGYEALLLFGRVWTESHFVINLGGLVDPGSAISGQRPTAIEGGIDFEQDLGKWDLSVTAELGAVRYFSPDPHELHATAGITWGVNDNLDLSIVGLAGFLSGGDHEGVLLGISPKIKVWQ
jgi:hypothetical protein